MSSSTTRVIIHVYDESRGTQRDFECALPTLLREMAYFVGHLGGAQAQKAAAAAGTMEISVHCDLEVFSWLLEYAQAPQEAQRRRPVLSNCIPILISSEFLQMRALVRECVSFIADNFDDAAGLPVDLCALSDAVLKDLSAKVSVDALEATRAASIAIAAAAQSRDRDRASGSADAESDAAKVPRPSGPRVAIVNKLYRLKLEAMLQQPDRSGDGGQGAAGSRRPKRDRRRIPRLSCCSCCGKVYATAGQDRLLCTRAKLSIDFHGNVLAAHTPSAHWTAGRYLNTLRMQRRSWRDLYWHVWGLARVLDCVECGRAFPVAEFAQCAYHPLAPSFVGASNAGVFPCCRRRTLRFDAASPARGSAGCCMREHKVSQEALERRARAARLALEEARLSAAVEGTRRRISGLSTDAASCSGDSADEGEPDRPGTGVLGLRNARLVLGDATARGEPSRSPEVEAAEQALSEAEEVLETRLVVSRHYTAVVVPANAVGLGALPDGGDAEAMPGVQWDGLAVEREDDISDEDDVALLVDFGMDDALDVPRGRPMSALAAGVSQSRRAACAGDVAAAVKAAAPPGVALSQPPSRGKARPASARRAASAKARARHSAKGDVPTRARKPRVAPPAGAAPMSVQDLFGERRLAFGDGEAEEPALSRSRRQMLIRAMDSERLQAMEKRLLAAREGESRPPAPVPVASTSAHPARGMRPASANPRSRVWNGGPGQGAGRASLKNPYASVRPSSARPFSARGAATRPSTARPTTARPVAARTGATRQHARPLSARRQRPQSAKPASRG